ncbi:MAG: hypothetical protein M1305_07660, partial [Candidatus Marsarchaeota archaeon]|nr:hypothetical protein [Candidatus Marsarchaeota archaeon]
EREGDRYRQRRSPGHGHPRSVMATGARTGQLGKVLAGDVARRLASGDLGGLDASTARHAAEYAGCTKAETLDLLRRDGRRAAEAVRALTDEQLDRQAPPNGTRPARTAQDVVERILINHVTAHGASIREALGQ